MTRDFVSSGFDETYELQTPEPKSEPVSRSASGGDSEDHPSPAVDDLNDLKNLEIEIHSKRQDSNSLKIYFTKVWF